MSTSTYIKLYQVENGVELQNRVTTIENLLDNGDFEVSEMNAKNGVIQDNFMVGFTDNTDLCDNLVMEVSGASLFHGSTTFDNNVQITGSTIFGRETSVAEEVSNNDTNLFVYGDLRIMDGGNLVIEDISNTTITELRTEVKITDSIDISNDGTSVAMIVNQIHTDVQDIVQFREDGNNVFTIGYNGNTYIQGDVSINSSLEISNNLVVRNEMFVDKDVSFGSHLQVVGDVSMESNVDISENLHVFNQLNVEKDVSFGTHLQVVGDVSMESNVDISENLHVFNALNVEKDVSFGTHLQVVGDVSMESNVDISENLHVFNQLNVEKDVSFGTHLQVVGDVSMESNVDISENLHVFNQLNVEKMYHLGVIYK